MDSKKATAVLKKLKNNKINHITICREIDLLGDCYYEEYIFYHKDLECFFHQILDWSIFLQSGFHRAVTFKKISEENAFELTKLASEVEKGLDDK